MNKLRDHTGVILWILVISFGIIWVLQDSGAFDVVGNTTARNIIEVDGDPITVEEYTRALDAQMQQYQNQTGETMPPQMVDLERERVFNALVEDRLREHEMDRLGITVTDEEVLEMVTGNTPHPIITMYFGDGQGGVNRAALQAFIDDPEARDEWIQLEDYLRAERRRAKLNAIIAATVRVSDREVVDEYNRRNRSVDARYVALRYAAIPDDSIKLADRDFRSFYNAHKEEFKRKKTFSMRYVTLSKEPTRQDSVQATTELERLRPTFATTTEDSAFLARNGSQRPFSGAYVRADEMEPEMASAIFGNLNRGAVIGPVIAGAQAHLVKVLDVRPAAEPVVQARHILIAAPEGNAAQRSAARAEAEQVKARLTGGADFAATARQVSDDPGSAVNGGDLGWFGRGRMVKPFEDAVFGAAAGSIVGPVETQFGYHIIQVTRKADQEVRLADFVIGVHANAATLSAKQEQLGDLQYYASESGDFAAEAKRRNLQVQQTQVEADQQFIPDLGNSRAIMNFLEGGKKGDVSDVIELNDRFVVVEITDVLPEGYRPLDEVRTEIEPRVRIEKKREILTARMQKALQSGGFDALARNLGTTEAVAQGITYNNPIVPALGRELKFTGTALGLAQGQTSGVIGGENAVYVLRVTAIHEPAPINAAMKEQLKQQMLGQRRATIMNQWLAQLREKADIKDNRRRFQQ